jgi:hypothetical protein
MAATNGNLIHAERILLAVGTPNRRATEHAAEAAWDTEGGRLAAA